jgi:hypothetical protein
MKRQSSCSYAILLVPQRLIFFPESNNNDGLGIYVAVPLDGLRRRPPNVVVFVSLLYIAVGKEWRPAFPQKTIRT